MDAPPPRSTLCSVCSYSIKTRDNPTHLYLLRKKSGYYREEAALPGARVGYGDQKSRREDVIRMRNMPLLDKSLLACQ